MKRIQFLSSMLLVSLMILIISCQEDTTIIDTNQITTSELDERFKSYEIAEIDNDVLWKMLEEQKDESVKLDMESATNNSNISDMSFTLNRQEILTQDFKVYLIGEGNELTEADILKPHVLKGEIDDDKGTAFMIVNNENFRAQFTIDEKIHRIEPLSDHIKDAVSNKYIIYNVDDITLQEEHTCDIKSDRLDLTREEEGQTEEALHEKSAGNCLKVEVSMMGDFALYRWRFNNNYGNTYNWMLWKVSQADNFYYNSNGYPIDLMVKSVYINTWNGYIAYPNNSAYGFNLQWQNFAVNNSWFQKGDVNILFTGNDIHPNSLGYGFIGSICNNNYGYNWGEGAFCTVEHQWNPYYEDITTAHEVGHVLGAGHTWGGFMNYNSSGSSTWMHPSTRNDLDNWIWGHSWCLGYWGCQ